MLSAEEAAGRCFCVSSTDLTQDQFLRSFCRLPIKFCTLFFLGKVLFGSFVVKLDAFVLVHLSIPVVVASRMKKLNDIFPENHFRKTDTNNSDDKS